MLIPVDSDSLTVDRKVHCTVVSIKKIYVKVWRPDVSILAGSSSEGSNWNQNKLKLRWLSVCFRFSRLPMDILLGLERSAPVELLTYSPTQDFGNRLSSLLTVLIFPPFLSLYSKIYISDLIFPEVSPYSRWWFALYHQGHSFTLKLSPAIFYKNPVTLPKIIRQVPCCATRCYFCTFMCSRHHVTLSCNHNRGFYLKILIS